ncbi:Mitochondrial zinc maintenance protein 1, mitochondrial [Lachancea thermotolerans]|uniref:Mitochondrial zinc maintenance protein 1, mitochondrial n=1 Tax=Lachancea thermotolerans (strain ATCC 56472 / CBS 6340 / NRRL Y-8284) TaxID=559295 RepID=MZM1_LACTC|nr:KLTH0C09482p [Lachancea thermotolerans CBS 6340]C5DEI4.1 RecName: Full=Mitochondrial zinc maintenance protein 1, mitochondrial; Flags: Precursor [Lachancea thermotolerans CBS 6340]CAR22195.1 KLTH0C09482p [Lachancea thermotolerans CBS 6340]
MSTSSMALAAYRNGLRATKVAFGQDLRMLQAARSKMREGMANPPNPELAPEQQIQHLNEVSQFLRRNIVQGKRGEGDKYTLNIHKETELGDNETIKTTKKTLVSRGGGCCGGGQGLYK